MDEYFPYVFMLTICRPRLQLLGFRSGTEAHRPCALIDALVGYCATLHMEISVAKTKVMVVSRSLARSPGLEAAVFTLHWSSGGAG
ncbi:TPA: hypothetical protein ACH3X1_001380 [Trebouxia sp. C0004]